MGPVCVRVPTGMFNRRSSAGDSDRGALDVDWYVDQPGGATELRHQIRRYLERHSEPDADIDAAELIASELIANALRHGQGPTWVSLTWSEEFPLLQVADLGPGFELDPGERVTLTVRPRKTAWRYLGSLGLWELQRRATRFTVTNNRLLVEEGVVKKVVSGVPLAAIQHVLVRTGPWEGTVDVGARGQSPSKIGPLGPNTARRLAAAISAHAQGAHVEEIEES